MREYRDDNSYFLTNNGGIIRCTYEQKNNVLFLSNLVVDYCYRKNGYGTQLLNDAEKKAKSLKCNAITLQVNEDSWMKEWYERLGFMCVGYGYEEGLLLMSKFI